MAEGTPGDRESRGRAIVAEMLGPSFLESMEKSRRTRTFGKTTPNSYSNVFADYWDRGGIERKMRSLVTMSFLIALRMPQELKHHVRGALNNGCTVEEIDEVLAQAAPYCGFPAAAIARQAAEEALQDWKSEHGNGRVGTRAAADQSQDL